MASFRDTASLSVRRVRASAASWTRSPSPLVQLLPGMILADHGLPLLLLLPPLKEMRPPQGRPPPLTHLRSLRPTPRAARLPPPTAGCSHGLPTPLLRPRASCARSARRAPPGTVQRRFTVGSAPTVGDPPGSAGIRGARPTIAPGPFDATPVAVTRTSMVPKVSGVHRRAQSAVDDHLRCREAGCRHIWAKSLPLMCWAPHPSSDAALPARCGPLLATRTTTSHLQDTVALSLRLCVLCMFHLNIMS